MASFLENDTLQSAERRLKSHEQKGGEKDEKPEKQDEGAGRFYSD